MPVISFSLTVFVRSFEASGIALRATMTTRTIDENFIACSEVRQRLKEEFEKNLDTAIATLKDLEARA